MNIFGQIGHGFKPVGLAIGLTLGASAFQGDAFANPSDGYEAEFRPDQKKHIEEAKKAFEAKAKDPEFTAVYAECGDDKLYRVTYFKQKAPNIRDKEVGLDNVLVVGPKTGKVGNGDDLEVYVRTKPDADAYSYLDVKYEFPAEKVNSDKAVATVHAKAYAAWKASCPK